MDTGANGTEYKMELNCKNYEIFGICDKADEYNDDDFNANKMCCHCGGGTTAKGRANRDRGKLDIE